MNGKGQFYLNIGITLLFGFYGAVGALYAEWLKPKYEWTGNVIAIDLTSSLILISMAIGCFSSAYRQIKKDDRV